MKIERKEDGNGKRDVNSPRKPIKCFWALLIAFKSQRRLNSFPKSKERGKRQTAILIKFLS